MCHLIQSKEVIKTNTLTVTKKMWMHILVAALISLPIVSVLDQSARADFVPTPPDDSGQTNQGGRGNRRAGSTR